MRIIAENDFSGRWSAWWADELAVAARSASVYGAVAHLINQSHQRDVTISSLKRDAAMSKSDHMEWLVAQPPDEMK